MKYYITTPIFYVNGAPHLGHVYTSVCTDFIARFKRNMGFDVYFLTGTDEHGQKVQKNALAKGFKSTQEFCDDIAATFESAMKELNISHDIFMRTSADFHKENVQNIWKKLEESGYIYLDKYSGWYSVRDEAFYDESEIVDGCAPSGSPVEWVDEESYFFKLSAFGEKLLTHFENNPNFIMPKSKANEVISFVKSGLKDLSISRTTFDWGIPVPNNDKHVMYVWLDALFNYHSATTINGKNDFWPADLHIIGKDILRFHAVYWPAFLMACDIELPKRIFAHGWWLVEGEKMAKSLGNVLDPFALKNEFGADYVRYYLIREMPFGNDHSYTREQFINRINSELCNNIGNLSQRVLSFIYKNCDSKIPEVKNLNSHDNILLNYAYLIVQRMEAYMQSQELHLVAGEIVDLGHKANEYIDKNAPWELKKHDIERMNTVLYVLAEVIRVIAISLTPVIPESAQKIMNVFNLKNNDFSQISKEFSLKSGVDINQPEVIFPRISR